MWTVIFLTAMVVVGILGQIFKDRQTNRKKTEQPIRPERITPPGERPLPEAEENSSEESTGEYDNRQVLMESLAQLGLPYHVNYDTESKDIMVTYQGYHFVIRSHSKSRYLQIIFYTWYDVPQYDYEEVARLHRAVNESNMACDINTVYVTDEEDNTVNIHSHACIVFYDGLWDRNQLLLATFNDFLRCRHNFILNLDRIRAEDQRLQEKR